MRISDWSSDVCSSDLQVARSMVNSASPSVTLSICPKSASAETRRYASLVPAAVLIGVPAVLVMLQPDLGTALMICASGATVMFLAGVPLRLFIGGALAFAIAAPLAVNFILHDYQRDSVLIFLDPESDPLGAGDHIRQSRSETHT